MKANTSSRFLAELIVACADAAAESATGVKDGLGVYLKAFKKIHERGGPLRVQFRCFEGCARFNARFSFEPQRELATWLRAPMKTIYLNKDIVVGTVELSAETDMLLAVLDFQAANARKLGLSLKGLAYEYRTLASHTDLCLPATRAAPWFRLGEIELEAGNPETAREHFKRAREIDSGWSLRYRVEAALAAFKKQRAPVKK